MNRPALILLTTALALGLAACRREAEAKAQPGPAPQAASPAPADGMAYGTVIETMDASTYTYVRLKTATGEIWAVGNKAPMAVGDKVHVPTGMPMSDFRSSSLNRTFPLIYFTAHIYKEGEGAAAPAAH